MIDQEILRQLVPNREPEDDFPRDSLPFRFSEGPERWISAWSAYLRWQLRAEMSDGYLQERLEQSGFIVTGIQRVTRPDEGVDPNFPVVGGYQFGTLLLRGFPDPERFPAKIALESGRLQVPVREVVASVNLHGRASADGFIAAVFRDEDDEWCGITARHVVQGRRRGDRLNIHCSDCGEPARMLRNAPGLIDAATVRLPCGGPAHYFPSQGAVRGAVEGETVRLMLGHTGEISCTVMASASTPAEIKSAAMPKHFLTEKHGYAGDSGSLVAAPDSANGPSDLIGMYLGDTVCEDPEGVSVTYGYALDLNQAADILGADDLWGDFNE